MPYLVLDNERIYYALYRGRLTGGSPIVLVHGAGESHLVWPAELRRLPDCTVIALDLPGHGKSSGAGRASVKDYTDWLAAFLDAVGTRQAIIVGHSMGGAIAQLFGLLYPDRAAGLVLVATGAKLRVSPQLLELTRSDLISAAELIGELEWGLNVPEQLKRLGKQQLLANRAEVLHNDYRACDAFDVVERLGDIGAPVLIVGGTADQLTPIKYARFMAERIPRARLVVVPDAGHMVMIEAAVTVSTEVEKFVRDIGRN